MPRPTDVYIDARRCIRCPTCSELAPQLSCGGPVPVEPHVLDAMEACPTGAIRWVEGDGTVRRSMIP